MTKKSDAEIRVFDNAVLLSACFHAPGCRRKVDTGDVEAGADKSMLHVSKDLIDSDEFRAIGRARGKFKRWLFARAIPRAVFRDGVYPLATALVPAVDEEIERFAREDAARVARFLAVYPQKIEDARGRLGRLFDAAEYPAADRLRAAFSIERHYVAIGAPELLRGLSARVWRREQAKIQKMWADAGEEIRAALRGGFAELVGRMVRRLSEGADGRRRIIKDAGVERLTEFLDTFDMGRDPTNDGELKALVARARAAMRGADAGALRDDGDLRKRVLKDFEQVAAAVEGWVVAKPSRRIALD